MLYAHRGVWLCLASMLTTSRTAVSTCAASASRGALARARALSAELPDKHNSSTTAGELESAEWWVEHDNLFQEAHREWGQKYHQLYDLQSHEDAFISPELRSAVAALEAAATSGGGVNESIVRELLRSTNVPGVWSFPLFTPTFCELLVEELQHVEASGIPLRRPNGMNRYGAILDQIGLEQSMEHLSRRFLRPLGQMIYPWLVAATDADEHYAFVVRYKLGARCPELGARTVPRRSKGMTFLNR